MLRDRDAEISRMLATIGFPVIIALFIVGYVSEPYNWCIPIMMMCIAIELGQNDLGRPIFSRAGALTLVLEIAIRYSDDTYRRVKT